MLEPFSLALYARERSAGSLCKGEAQGKETTRGFYPIIQKGSCVVFCP
jgi:hypothetical protein